MEKTAGSEWMRGFSNGVSGVVASEPTPLSPSGAGADPESPGGNDGLLFTRKEEFQAKPKAGETDSPGVT